ncbi:helix-turn-helix domain-containing protein [Desulfotalea psychrophila]|nr:helix-turn-helix transcriptional regulator [Desulfotalea psychrophila]
MLLVSTKEIGDALRHKRKQMGLSQSELGKRVGLDQKKVSLMENGNPNTRVESLLRLLSALELGVVLQPKADSSQNDSTDF